MFKNHFFRIFIWVLLGFFGWASLWWLNFENRLNSLVIVQLINSVLSVSEKVSQHTPNTKQKHRIQNRSEPVQEIHRKVTNAQRYCRSSVTQKTKRKVSMFPRNLWTKPNPSSPQSSNFLFMVRKQCFNYLSQKFVA